MGPEYFASEGTQGTGESHYALERVPCSDVFFVTVALPVHCEDCRRVACPQGHARSIKYIHEHNTRPFAEIQRRMENLFWCIYYFSFFSFL